MSIDKYLNCIKLHHDILEKDNKILKMKVDFYEQHIAGMRNVYMRYGEYQVASHLQNILDDAQEVFK